jgi:hypothetical protein
MEDVDHKVSLIWLYIKLWYGARFAYFMERKYKWLMRFFLDTSEIIKAIEKRMHLNSSKTNISATAFEIVTVINLKITNKNHIRDSRCNNLLDPFLIW